MNYLVVFLLMIDICFSDNDPPENNACCYDKHLVEKKLLSDQAMFDAYMTKAKWPGSKIYYDIDPHMDIVIRHYVAKAIDYFNLNPETCVQWVQRHPDGSSDSRMGATKPGWVQLDPDGSQDHAEKWVTFWQLEGDIMAADVGFDLNPSNQKNIYLGREFFKSYLGKLFVKGRKEAPAPKDLRGLVVITSLLHEMMHVLGFKHEHQRGDRDCWIYVSDKIIKEKGEYSIHYDYKSRFSPKFPYDLESIMHYPSALPDFYAHDDGSWTGRFDGQLSGLDLDKMNHVYCRHKPAYCDLYPKCKQDLEYYRHNPKCFREGEKYNFTPTTCTPCYIP